MEQINIDNDLNLLIIDVNVVLSVGKGFELLSGYSIKTVLGYSINNNLSLEKNETDLKNLMIQSIKSELSCLPTLMEKMNEFSTKLHCHSNLEEELIKASKEKLSGKTHIIYLCIH